MITDWINRHKTFYRFSPATAGQLDQLKRTTGYIFPSEIYDFLGICNGGEGFIGDHFIRLYSVEQLLTLNPAYKIDEFMPGYVLIGCNRGGEAYAINAQLKPAPVIQIPFIPMAASFVKPIAPSISAWHATLAAISPSITNFHTPSSQTFQKVIHEVNPIVFGGSPTDLSNKALVPIEAHAEGRDKFSGRRSISLSQGDFPVFGPLIALLHGLQRHHRLGVVGVPAHA